MSHAKYSLKLQQMVDGSLEPREKIELQHHIATCDECQRTLPQLLIVEDALTRAAEAENEGAKIFPLLPRSKKESSVFKKAAAIAAGIAATVLVGGQGRILLTKYQHRELVLSMIDPTKREFEARLSYAPLDEYADFDTTRGTSAGGCVSAKDLAALEESGDHHGVAAVLMRACGKDYLDEAMRQLERATSSVEVESDRGALLLARGTVDDIPRAAELYAELLAKNPDHRAARWNFALALRALYLSRRAAAEFTAIAAWNEPGWSKEAAALTKTLAAGEELDWRTGVSHLSAASRFPNELAGKYPWLARRAIYRSARLATSREELIAMMPLARQIDDKHQTAVLSNYLERLGKQSFAERAALAKTYRNLEMRSRSGPIAVDDLDLKKILSSKEADLIAGAVLVTGTVSAHLDKLREAAAALGDPWFSTLAGEREAELAFARGDSEQAKTIAQRTLQDALDHRMTPRAARLELLLSRIALASNRPNDARAFASSAMQRARPDGEVLTELETLRALADLERAAGRPALERLYREELVLREKAVAGLEGADLREL